MHRCPSAGRACCEVDVRHARSPALKGRISTVLLPALVACLVAGGSLGMIGCSSGAARAVRSALPPPTGSSSVKAGPTTRATSTAQTANEAVVGAAVAASGEAIPAADVGPWKHLFSEDFDTSVSPGGFLLSPAYRNRWAAYERFNDTRGIGRYSLENVSVAEGVLNVHLSMVNGVPVVAALVPLPFGQWGGTRYGRYSVRFRSDPLPGYKTSWLLWPDSNRWTEGEIDFPEGELDGTISAFNHRLGRPQENTLVRDTGVTYRKWHTATVEWSPVGVTYYLDGHAVAVSHEPPHSPMHVVLQTETARRPEAATAGNVQIDWISLWRYAA